MSYEPVDENGDNSDGIVVYRAETSPDGKGVVVYDGAIPSSLPISTVDEFPESSGLTSSTSSHRNPFEGQSEIEMAQYRNVVSPLDRIVARLKTVQADLPLEVYNDIETILEDYTEYLSRNATTVTDAYQAFLDLPAHQVSSKHLNKNGTTAYTRQLDRYMKSSYLKLCFERLPWLTASMILQTFISVLLTYLMTLITTHIVLVTFVPCLIGTVGNASLQPSVWVRNACQFSPSLRWAVIKCEEVVSLIIAVALACVLFVVVVIEYPEETVVAGTLAITMCISILVAVTIGIVITVLLSHIKKCNAIEGALTVITTLVDMVATGILYLIVDLFRTFGYF